MAIKHAQAIAEHMAHRISADWLGWAVELRNGAGIKFIEIPVVLEVVTDAGSFPRRDRSLNRLRGRRQTSFIGKPTAKSGLSTASDNRVGTQISGVWGFE